MALTLVPFGRWTLHDSASFPHGRQTNLNDGNMKVGTMRESYDFSNSIKNPYAKRMKQQITIRIMMR